VQEPHTLLVSFVIHLKGPVASYTQSSDEMRGLLKLSWFNKQIAGPPKVHVTVCEWFEIVT
jgi:hypothetical protein